MAPKDPAAWVGERLTFADASTGSIAFAKIHKLWARGVPGAWLTWSDPGIPPNPAGEAGQDDEGEAIDVA